jgi:hypothetical protein
VRFSYPFLIFFCGTPNFCARFMRSRAAGRLSKIYHPSRGQFGFPTACTLSTVNSPRTGRMGPSQGSVLIEAPSAVAESHSETHIPHKTFSSTTQPLTNGHTPQRTPNSSFVQDKSMLMGNRSLELTHVDTTLSLDLRNKLGIRGIMPPAVDTPDIQIERCLARIRAKKNNLDKYAIPIKC